MQAYMMVSPKCGCAPLQLEQFVTLVTIVFKLTIFGSSPNAKYLRLNQSSIDIK